MATHNCKPPVADCRLRADDGCSAHFAFRDSRSSLRHRTLRGSLWFLILSVLSGCNRMPDVGRSEEGFRWPERILTLEEKRLEGAEKLSRVVGLLKREHLSALLVITDANFAWISAGSEGAVPLLIRDDGKRYLLTTAAQGARLLDEGLKGMGFELRETAWYSGKFDSSGPDSPLRGLTEGAIGADALSPGCRLLEKEIADLRTPLTAGEIREYRWLGQRCAEAVESVCRRLQPDMTEKGIEALLTAALLHHSIRPVSIWVTTDNRIGNYGASPAAEDRKLEKTALVRVCGRRWGLHVALARMTQFGPVPDELQRAAAAGARVNAGFWARTLPGAAESSIVEGAYSDYAEVGFRDEWRRSGQGGPIGYLSLDWAAMRGSGRTIRADQAFAWSPSVHGVRVEDTILVGAERMEVLTRTPDWPVIESRTLGRIYRSAGILAR